MIISVEWIEVEVSAAIVALGGIVVRRGGWTLLVDPAAAWLVWRGHVLCRVLVGTC